MLFNDRKECVKHILENYKKWHPFPKYDERDEWEGLSETVKQTYIEEAELYHGKSMEWPIIPATLWMRPARDGDRSVYMERVNDRLRKLVVLTIAECITASGKYLDDVIDAAVMIAEEGAWNFPPHNVTKEEPLYNALKPRVDLQTGERANAIALVVYLIGDKIGEVSSYVVPQLKTAVYKFMVEPMINIQYDYFWIGKKAWSNWSPWVCENLMQSMFMCGYADDDIAKVMDVVFETLEKYYTVIDDDCGNLEGSTYWTASAGRLFNCLDILYAVSGGKVNAFSDKKIKRMPRNMFDLHLVDDYVFNYGDSDAKNNGYYPILYRFAKRIGDEDMKNFALCQMRKYKLSKQMQVDWCVDFREVLNTIFIFDEMSKATAGPFEKKDAYYEQSKYLIARSNGDSKFILAAKAGILGSQHSHHDVGNFILFKDNNPVFIDIGAETYCQKTFSEERWTIPCMQSSWHNLPDVNGLRQELGAGDPTVNKMVMNDDVVEFETELAKVFVPESKLQGYIRNVKLDKKTDTFYLLEDITFEKGSKNNVVFHYLSATKPQVKGSELYFGDFAVVKITADKDYKLYVEDVKFEDKRLIKVWGESVYRTCIEFNDVDSVKLNATAK